MASLFFLYLSLIFLVLFSHRMVESFTVLPHHKGWSNLILALAKRRTIIKKNNGNRVPDYNDDSKPAIKPPYGDIIGEVAKPLSEQYSTTVNEGNKALFAKSFEEDLSDFKTQESKISSPIEGNKINEVGKSIKDAFSFILIADFFLVIGFLIWFLIAAVLKSSYPVVLEKFQDIFNPVVVPSLTVLMIGSIASGFGGKSSNEK